jgi:hypothetical protein
MPGFDYRSIPDCLALIYVQLRPRSLRRTRTPSLRPDTSMNRELASETEAYQALLEGHRGCPDDEELYLDMLKARAAMEVAWLSATPTGA